jgi:ribosome biogenesis GTPase / thiamine phosphate phosphatase
MPRTVMVFDKTAFFGSGSASITSEKQNESGSISGVTLLDSIGVLSSGGQIFGVLETAGAQAASKEVAPTKTQSFFIRSLYSRFCFFAFDSSNQFCWYCKSWLRNLWRGNSMNQALLELGWSDFFETEYQQFLRLNPEIEVQLARVIGVDRTTFRIQTQTASESAMLPGALLHGANKIMPVMGDWVIVQRIADTLQIVQILRRSSEFSRAVHGGTSKRPKASTQQVMTANVDTVFIISSLDDDFNLPRLTRYVTAVQNSGAKPVIVLNKADLVLDVQIFFDQAKAIASNLEVFALSAAHGLGLEQLQPYFQQGKTIALIGSSGVGKSTLTNQILGREVALTADSQTEHFGQHTTTARTMYFIPSGGLLVDNPGLREIAVWETEKTDYSDIESLAAQCKFRKCTHTGEFGCMVQKAIRNKKLEPDRLVAYQLSLGIKVFKR